MSDKFPKTIRIGHDFSKLYFAVRDDEGVEYVRADVSYQRWNETSVRLSEAELRVRLLEDDLSILRDAVRELPVEEMIVQEADGSPTLVGYCMQSQGEWDSVRRLLEPES